MIRETILTSDQVGCHENFGQLVGVLVLAEPHGVELLLKVLPEVWQGNGLGVLVGVGSLELIHVEVTRNETKFSKLIKIL